MSENVQGCVVLKEQKCTLDSKLCDLVFLEPSLRICVNFISQAQDDQCANNLPSVQTINTKHIFTACLPLSKVCQDLLEHGTCVHESITSEDNNKTWQLHLCMADAANLSAQSLRKRSALLAKCRDTALVHKAMVTQLHGYCKSLGEIVREVSCCRETRKQANAAVLRQLTTQVMPTVWELQMSRALNTAITDKGIETAKLSNEQLEFLREGAQTGGQLEQTMLLFVNSLLSTVVSNAQGADVLIAYNHTNNAAMFDPLALHQANHDFVRENGAEALMQKLLYNCQQNICEQIYAQKHEHHVRYFFQLVGHYYGEWAQRTFCVCQSAMHTCPQDTREQHPCEHYSRLARHGHRRRHRHCNSEARCLHS